MSDDNNDDEAEGLPSPAYKVGYKKPPVTHQFQKGKPGNPHGRPRREMHAETLPSNFDRLRKEELLRLVAIQDENGAGKIPIIQAAFRSQAVKSAKGDRHAQEEMNRAGKELDRLEREEKEKILKIAFEHKRYGEQQLRRLGRLDESRPDFLPHPNDVLVEPAARRYVVVGPFNSEEKRLWDKMDARRLAAKLALEKYTKRIKRSLPLADILNEDIAFEQQVLSLIDRRFPEADVRREHGFDHAAWRHSHSGSRSSKR